MSVTIKLFRMSLKLSSNNKATVVDDCQWQVFGSACNGFFKEDKDATRLLAVLLGTRSY